MGRTVGQLPCRKGRALKVTFYSLAEKSSWCPQVANRRRADSAVEAAAGAAPGGVLGLVGTAARGLPNCSFSLQAQRLCWEEDIVLGGAEILTASCEQTEKVEKHCFIHQRPWRVYEKHPALAVPVISESPNTAPARSDGACFGHLSLLQHGP